MRLSTSRVFGCGCAALLVFSCAVDDARAVAIVAAKTDNLLQNQTTSAFFTQNIANSLDPPPAAADGWAPTAPHQAGTAGSVTTKKSYSVVGNSTAVGNWIDFNGVPTGITLAFDAEFTITALTPAGSLLTNVGTTSGNFGQGIGVTQTPGGANDINTGDGIQVSPVVVSNVSFTGTLADPGFTFTPGGVSGFGTRVIRSSTFDNVNSGMLLTQGTDTIGFGVTTGTIASNQRADNNFGNDTVSSSSVFPRQPGPYTLVVTQGVSVIKGIGLGYDVTYDITPVAAVDNADFNGDTFVNGEDFLIWQSNFLLESGATRAQGNANPSVDGAVDDADFAIWKNQFGTTPAIAAAGQVPEPAAAALLVVGGMALLASRRRRSRA